MNHTKRNRFFVLCLTLLTLAASCKTHGTMAPDAGQVPAPHALMGTNWPIAYPQSTFVFKPGGVVGGNVFTTWATLMAAMALMPTSGVKWVTVDDSLAAAHATAGTWNINNVSFIAAGSFNVLHLDAGCVFTFVEFWIGPNVEVTQDGNAPVIAMAAGFAEVHVTGVLQSTVASAFARLTGTAVFQLNTYDPGAVLGDGTHPVVEIAAAGVTVVGNIAGNGSNVTAHAFKGAVGTLQVSLANNVTFAAQADFSGTLTTILSASASLVGFTPATAGNWQPAPTQVKAALDQLAAPNFVQAQANTGTGTGTTTAVTGNIAKLRSGKVSVIGDATGITAGGGTTVTVSLLRDATPILALPAITTLSTLSFAVPINIIDTLPDTAAHTYKVQAVAGAGNITCGAGGNTISASEY